MPFVKTQTSIRQMNSLEQRTQEAVQELSSYPDCVNPLTVHSLLNTLKDKTEDFFGEDRQLHLAVIGQVKAGKSSFLNELLFEGNSMLPFDNLPKTSTPTRICYSPQNMLEITYINRSDIEQIEKLSALDAQIPMVRAAHDLNEGIKRLDYNIDEYLLMDTQRILADSIDELFHRLDDYVSENGQFTPLVKDVTLHVNLTAIKDIVIADTHGLNDPVVSRSEKTKQYIETCDAAFFLSHSGSFLDDTDIKLLTSILPQKGIKDLIVVASQLDSALMDTIYDFGSLNEAYESTIDALLNHAKNSYSKEFHRMLEQDTHASLIKVIECLREPIFASAMTRRMSRINKTNYTEYQHIIYQRLSMYEDIDNVWLERISGFDKILQRFEDILERKDELMQSKANSFVLLTKSDIESRFIQIKEHIQQEQKKNSIEILTAKRNDVVKAIHDAQKSVSLAFDEYLSPLEGALQSAALEINALKDIHNQVSERTDILVNNQAITISDTKLFLPWTWGASHTEYRAEEISVSFVDIGEHIKNLQYITDNVEALSHQVFDRFSDTTALKNHLNRITGIANGSLHLDVQDITRGTADALKTLSVPVCSYDCTRYIKRLEGRFSGRIKAPDREAVGTFYSAMVNEMLNEYYHLLENNSTIFSKVAESAKERFCSLLCKEWYDKLRTLGNELDTMQSHLHRLHEASEVIDRFLT